MPAPPITAARWFHGTPVSAFSTGRVYVVEFRSARGAATPIVTALAQKNVRQASVLSVSVAEPGADLEQQATELAAFVRSQGPRLKYALAADTTNRPLAQTWLQAAGATNLPVAFVVGKDGALAWIGHPAKGLDEAVATALRELPPHVKARTPSPELALRQRVAALRRAGKPREALAAIDEATASDPILARSFLSLRMSLLFQLDAAAARAEGRKLADGLYRNDPPVLTTLAGILLAQREPADKAYALTLAERACEQTGYDDVGMVSLLARAQAGNGNPAKSVEVLEALAKNIETSGGANTPELQKVRGEIATYRKTAKMPAPAGSEPAEAPNQGLLVPR